MINFYSQIFNLIFPKYRLWDLHFPGSFQYIVFQRHRQPATVFKKSLRHMCFPVNFDRFLDQLRATTASGFFLCKGVSDAELGLLQHPRSVSVFFTSFISSFWRSSIQKMSDNLKGRFSGPQIWIFINPLSANPTKWSNTQAIRRKFSDELFECVWQFCGIGAQRIKKGDSDTVVFP